MSPNTLLQALTTHAWQRPYTPALEDERGTLNYAELLAEIQRLESCIDGHIIGLLADNSVAWMLLDLAAQSCGVTCVPLPDFFSDAQLRHIIDETGMDRVFTDRPARLETLLGRKCAAGYDIAGKRLSQFVLPPCRREMAADKLTFTSGTTARPKGVCLDTDCLLLVAGSLSQVLNCGSGDRFLSLLPLAVLLENISVYAALLAGASVYLPGTRTSGISVTCLDIDRLCRVITDHHPAVLVLVPQMLKALLGAVDGGWTPPDNLRFIAIGGAAVAPALLQQARDRGLPAYEGYGLSEANSVVSLNLPDANCPGSAGRPLPHVRLRVADDGEILIGGALFRGYLGEKPRTEGFWPSGDLGYLDDDGFLFLQGRKGNRIITAYGRNLSPEWPERELLAQRAIAQAIVVGDARPFNSALIVAMPGTSCAQIEAAVNEANARLPEYAHISRWHLCADAFSTGEGELSANGRPRRAVIAEHYRAEIEQLYQEQKYGIL